MPASRLILVGLLLWLGIHGAFAASTEPEDGLAGTAHALHGADPTPHELPAKDHTVHGSAGTEGNSRPNISAAADDGHNISASADQFNQSSMGVQLEGNETNSTNSSDPDPGVLIPKESFYVEPVEVARLMPELMDSILPSGECSDKCSHNKCNGHGVCRLPACECNCTSGFTGQFCEERVAVIFNFKLRPPPKPCPDNCAGQGICNHNGTCDCGKGWAGLNCSIECVGGAANPCSGHGMCNKTDGKCICAEGYEGKNCNRRILPQNVEEYRKTLLGVTEKEKEKEEGKQDPVPEQAALHGEKQPSEPDASKNLSESATNVTAQSNQTEAKNGTEANKIKWIQGSEIGFDRLASIGVNHAAFDLGAKALASNKEAKGQSALLKNDRDKYWISPCKVDKGKWIVIELNELVYVHTIVIGSFEYYSSTVNAFQVLGHQSYPTETWTLLGHFQASPSRKMQEFKLKTKKLAKYIKIKMLSHHANEFYCTLSSVRVFGTTQWEEMSRMLDENEEFVEAAKRRLDGVEEQKKEESAEEHKREESAVEPGKQEQAAGANRTASPRNDTAAPSPSWRGDCRGSSRSGSGSRREQDKGRE